MSLMDYWANILKIFCWHFSNVTFFLKIVWNAKNTDCHTFSAIDVYKGWLTAVMNRHNQQQLNQTKLPSTRIGSQYFSLSFNVNIMFQLISNSNYTSSNCGMNIITIRLDNMSAREGLPYRELLLAINCQSDPLHHECFLPLFT